MVGYDVEFLGGCVVLVCGGGGEFVVYVCDGDVVVWWFGDVDCGGCGWCDLDDCVFLG